MRNKSDVLAIVHHLFAFVETQFLTVIRKFRSDNAPKLSFIDLFKSKGVEHQFSCVGRSQQNSVVERKYQHLPNVFRALMFQARLPISFWGECILTATFLINRLPSLLLPWKNPHYRLFGTNADYNLIKVFDSLCFASTLANHRTKFQSRAIPCVFFGYPQGMKGYKLYDMENKKFLAHGTFFMKKYFPSTKLLCLLKLKIYS